MPSLAELRGRAVPWAEHLRVEQAWPGRPAAYLLRGLLSEKEIQEMFGLAAATLQGNRTEWHSKVHAVSSLRYVPDAASAAPVRALNARLATLVGLPQSHVEEGYLNLYKAGYELTGLHLDNHHVLFSPRRVASVVMYLTGEDEGLDGGCTVFPLAGAAADSPDEQEISDKASRWDARLSSSTAEFELGKNPMWGRACPLSLQASWPEGDLCLDALARARELCASGCNRSAPEASSLAGALARARRGDAIIFETSGGQAGAFSDTVKAMHGSCGVQYGNKLMLAKFIRGGPGPHDERDRYKEAIARYVEAERARRGRQAQENSPAASV